jgi:hypothetical protein
MCVSVSRKNPLTGDDLAERELANNDALTLDDGKMLRKYITIAHEAIDAIIALC